MIQFLSNTVATRMTEKPLLIVQRPRTCHRVLVLMVTGLASSLIVTGYLAQEHPTVAVLSSLLSGFAPLIGLFVLLVIVSLLISYLICTVERMLADEDDGIVREPHFKSKWIRVKYFPSELFCFCVGLKEHSPPAFSIS